jgi:hypothetical protein
MATVYSFKVAGLTSASATIATLDVTWCTDGYLRFTDANGDPHAINIGNGCGGHIADLLKSIFTGSGGLDADSAGVQGASVFGSPKLIA